MNISDYSTKAKNLADALASIGAPVNDEDLAVVTLNGLGKDYNQFRTSIAIQETFPNFQDLITLLISVFYSNSNRGRGRGAKSSFQGRHGSSHGGHENRIHWRMQVLREFH
jgi:hypothetical protein